VPGLPLPDSGPFRSRQALLAGLETMAAVGIEDGRPAWDGKLKESFARRWELVARVWDGSESHYQRLAAECREEATLFAIGRPGLVSLRSLLVNLKLPVEKQAGRRSLGPPSVGAHGHRANHVRGAAGRLLAQGGQPAPGP
jgi:hypothetical protein